MDGVRLWGSEGKCQGNHIHGANDRRLPEHLACAHPSNKKSFMCGRMLLYSISPWPVLGLICIATS